MADIEEFLDACRRSGMRESRCSRSTCRREFLTRQSIPDDGNDLCPPCRGVSDIGMPAHWRVVIDETDKCDVCGPEARGRFAVCFGAGKPVICFRCIELGQRIVEDTPRWQTEQPS